MNNATTSNYSTVTLAGPVNYQDILIGCLLSIGGNMLISISLTLQKYTHMQIENGPDGPDAEQPASKRRYYLDRRWWFAIILMVCGEVGNFSAYGFAPASMVAPLGTTTVVANMFLAVLALKEKLKVEDLFGSALAIIGAFLIVNFSSKVEVVRNADEVIKTLSSPLLIVYLSVVLGLIIVLLVLMYKINVENILVILLLASLFASFTIISTKAVSGMLNLTLQGNNQLTSWIFYVMVIVLVITCILQVKYLNSAMKLFDATLVVPTYFVFFTISAILAGIIFYKEFEGMDVLQIFMFLFGCFLCFVGVYFITAGRAGDSFSTTFANTKSLLPIWLFSKSKSHSNDDSKIFPDTDSFNERSNNGEMPLTSAAAGLPDNNYPVPANMQNHFPQQTGMTSSYGATDDR